MAYYITGRIIILYAEKMSKFYLEICAKSKIPVNLEILKKTYTQKPSFVIFIEGLLKDK